MKQKFFTLFLTLATSVGTIYASMASGNCGSHLSWSLNTDEGVLIIEGSGAMFNWYSASETTWNEWSEYVEKVILPPDLTSIGQYAFQSMTNLTTIEWNCKNCTISDYLTKTPFYDNRSHITTFIIGDEVETIPQYLCYEMTNLTEVEIPNSVQTIGFQSFHACSSLSTVSIGSGVTSVGGNAFYDCKALIGVYISDIAAWCSIDFGAISNPLIYAYNLYLNGELLEDLVIPYGVTAVKDDVFYNGQCFKSVSIPNSVTSIGNSSFYQCRNLRSVSIPNSVISIGKSAFNICDALETVTLGNSVESIGDYAFWGCPFTTITIPASVTSIGNGALTNHKLEEVIVDVNNQNYCSVEGVLFNKDITSLRLFPAKKSVEYTMPQSVITIGDLAFTYSTFTHIELPEGVTSIGYDSFESCRNLVSITLPNSLITIGRYAFSRCEKLEEIVIPNNVISIEDQAFYYCQSLNNVTIGSGVTTIGQYIFRDCFNISSIYNYASTPQSIKSNVFESVDKSSCILYVPKESIELYETADVWKEFSIQAIQEEVTDFTIKYVDKDADFIDSEAITLNLPETPIFAGFTFLKWVVVAGDLEDGITIQATYTYNGILTSAPEEYTNPSNPAQKLVRNGNVYILNGEKTYTIQGNHVK